jgi:hypothetical protein
LSKDLGHSPRHAVGYHQLSFSQHVAQYQAQTCIQRALWQNPFPHYLIQPGK